MESCTLCVALVLFHDAAHYVFRRHLNPFLATNNISSLNALVLLYVKSAFGDFC